jgi:hypothetical protein
MLDIAIVSSRVLALALFLRSVKVPDMARRLKEKVKEIRRDRTIILAPFKHSSCSDIFNFTSGSIR